MVNRAKTLLATGLLVCAVGAAGILDRLSRIEAHEEKLVVQAYIDAYSDYTKNLRNIVCLC